MTKRDVIEYIANNRILEDIVKNIAGTYDEDLKDLIQDIYLDLYNKDDNTLIKLYTEKSLKYYLTKIVFNNIYSSNSRFYYIYKKNIKNKVDIDDLKDEY